MHNQSHATKDFNLKLTQELWFSLLTDDPPFLHHHHQFNHHFFPLLLTFTVPPVWKQLVATWARAVIRARDVDALVDAQLPSLVHSSSVHFTLINICQNSPGPVDVSKGILKGIQNVEVFFFFKLHVFRLLGIFNINLCGATLGKRPV